MSEDLKSQVSAALDSAPAPVAEVGIESVSAPAVKEEPVVVVPEPVAPVATPEVKTVDEWKLALQIENLNKAISIEREEKSAMKAELEKVKPFMEKMQNAFAPEQVAVETPAPVVPNYMTPEQLDEWYTSKEAAKVQESEQKQLQEKINSEIQEMTTKWNGEDWKPKYDDAEVINWQRYNNKLYLMPNEAFLLMKRDDIINWETKQVMSRGAWEVTAERPSGLSAEHTPSSITPKTDQELKAAITEALSSIE